MNDSEVSYFVGFLSPTSHTSLYDVVSHVLSGVIRIAVSLDG